MLEQLFGTKTAAFIMLYLFHYGEVHARALARDIGISLSSIQNKLAKFEESGVIISRKMGTTRIYSFNLKSPLTRPLMELIKVVHTTMSLEDKEQLFKERKRPRRAGKPVIGRTSRN